MAKAIHPENAGLGNPARATSGPITPAERWLLAGVAALLACAIALPPFAQQQAYHDFADSRRLLGIPNALDVLSNLGFLAGGLWGLLLIRRRRLHFFSAALALSAIVTFTGFVLTSFGSVAYHLTPSDPGLALDRLGMVIAFAGVLGMAAAQRVSDRAGRGLLALALALGPCTVALWHVYGNLTPYAVMQYGGLVTAIGLLMLPARGPGPHWAWLIAAYALAKVFEGADHFVFEATQGLVSGHTLKHLVAALSVLSVTLALDVRRRAQ